MKTNEKYRFGKRYYQREDGTWVYLRDTLAEEEYRDRMHDRVDDIKTKGLLTTMALGAGYIYFFRPDIVEAINTNPVLNSPIVIGIEIMIIAVAALLLLGFGAVVAYLFLKEAVPAFKRDILGIDQDNEE